MTNKSLIFTITIAILLLSAFLVTDIRDDYKYRAYILENQYIGDITVNDDLYSNVLIMDVKQLADKYGNVDLYYCEQKYGFRSSGFFIDGNKYVGLVPLNYSSRLYFANEHSIREDLKNNSVIGVRWTNKMFGEQYIRGVGDISDGFI